MMKILSKRMIDLDAAAALPAGKKEEALRTLREPLLAAFDVYKQNIGYGIITETETEHETVMEWYRDLCDLKEGALREVPAKIKKYVRGWKA